MNEFLQYIGYLLERGLVFAALATLLGAGVMAWCYRRFRKKNSDGKFPWGRAVLILMLVGYLAVVLAATVLRTSGGRGLNLHLFLSWREAWNQFTLKLWLNILLNIAMFVPLGILLPLLWKRFEKWQWTFAAGFGLSLSIELMQMVTGNLTDVDDLMHNTLGAVLGWCAVMLALRLKRREPKRALRCLAVPLCTAAVFGGVFLTYSLQEFGNLEFAPTYRADTKNVEWSLECSLEGGKTAPVYSLEPFDKASADAFGQSFFQRIGREALDVYYYDNQTIMGSHSTGPFLNIDWLDRTWNVSGFEFPGVTYEVDEAGMRAELELLELFVPEEAVFEYLGEGKARLTADQIRIGNTLYNGWVQRWVDNAGEYHLDWALVVCTVYRDVEILTPEQAYGRLCAGDFYHPDWIGYYGVEAASVTGWRLGYQVDSKGFYQPVYIFTLQSEQAKYAYDAYVPAIS